MGPGNGWCGSDAVDRSHLVTAIYRCAGVAGDHLQEVTFLTISTPFFDLRIGLR